MGLSWDAYMAIYYSIQIVLYPVIYFILMILIPAKLMNWLLRVIFLWNKPQPKEENDLKNQTTTMNTGVQTNPSSKHPDCDTCNKIWEWFENLLEEIWSVCCCSPCNRCKHNGLEDTVWPSEQSLQLEPHNNASERVLHNLCRKRISIYSLLCTAIWCAAIAFFEGVILGYAPASNGESCPTPKRGSNTLIMDCFVYVYQFDSSPVNKTFPVYCNRTEPPKFNGNWVGCFGWIYKDVEVVEVIDALGICTGIVAFIGITVALISFLCQQHGWRLFFDILACAAVGVIPILVWSHNYVPFLTYILLISLSLSIITIEYLLNYVPLLTWLCLVKAAYLWIKGPLKCNHTTTVTQTRENHDYLAE